MKTLTLQWRSTSLTTHYLLLKAWSRHNNTPIDRLTSSWLCSARRQRRSLLIRKTNETDRDQLFSYCSRILWLAWQSESAALRRFYVNNHFIVAVGWPLVEPVHSLVKWSEDKWWEYYMLWPTKIAVLTFDQAAFSGQHAWFDAWLLSD